MLEPNEGKLAFSRAISYQQGDTPTSDVCHNYGIMSGCDEGCPALLSGDCEQPYDAIECCLVTEEERKEILDNYVEVSYGDEIRI